MSRTAKFVNFVIPNCPQPRLRGEDGEEPAFFRSRFSRWEEQDFPDGVYRVEAILGG